MIDFQTTGNFPEMPSSPVPQLSLLAVCTGLPWLLHWNLVHVPEASFEPELLAFSL